MRLFTGSVAVHCTNTQNGCKALPEIIKLDVSLGDQINANFNASEAPSRVILSLDSGNVSEVNWNEMSVISLKPDHKIGKAEPLFAKIESSDIDKQKAKLGD